MSIRTNPMNAVPFLLNRVKATRSKFLQSGRDESFDAKMQMLTRELTKIEDVFMRVKRNQDHLLDTLHEVDGHLRKLDRKRLDQDMDHFCKRIRDCAHKLLPMDDFDEDQNTQTVQSSDHPSSSQHNNNHLLLPQPLLLRWGELSLRQQRCLLYFSIFPKDAVLKKRQTIDFWIGLGLIFREEEKIAEEVGEEVFDQLFKLNVIVPCGNAKSPIVNKFQIHPRIHPLIQHNNNHLLLPQPVHLRWNAPSFRQHRCLASLLIFPKDAVLKKRLAIYLWIGMSYVTKTEEKTGEEEGEEVIDQLLKLNLIVPYGNAKSPIVNKFQIHPLIYPHLEAEYKNWLLLRQRNVTIRLESKTACSHVINASSRYLNFGSQWLDKRCSLKLLQLGRWQDSPSHHIEVANQVFLNNLGHQRELRYLSLRGISRVFELPPSITNVESLQILDLKACHNLETLPDDISSMKSLTHLILSQCYMLDGMPKGIEKLTKLEVLNGFLIGSSTKTPISDLENLKKLRRLSIHIGREAVINNEEFKSLGKLSKLQHLKISWGVFDTKYSEIQINLPSSLKKLHLQGFPGQKIPEWLKPSKVPVGLKELSLTGGKLESMNHNSDRNQWGMEIVRLKYLKHLKIDIPHLRMLFPSLKYALMKPIPKSYTEWSIND